MVSHTLHGDLILKLFVCDLNPEIAYKMEIYHPEYLKRKWGEKSYACFMENHNEN